MDNLLSLLRAALPSNFASLLSAYLDEAETPTQNSLTALLPALLAAFSQKGATPSGAANLMNILQEPEFNASLIDNVADLFAGSGTGANELLNIGADMVNKMFGNKGSALADALASLGGLKSSSAMNLLALGVPVVLSFLKKYIFGNNLNQNSLSALLSGQGQNLQGLLDTGLVKAMGYDSPDALFSCMLPPKVEAIAQPAYVPEAEVRKSATWLPWLLGLLALLGLLYLWQVFSKPAPVAVKAPAVAPVAYCLPANVYFEVGEAVIDPANQETIAKTAACIKKEGLKVAISGYTDRTGDWATNVELAKNRAKVVRDALVAAGVPEAGIILQDPKEWTGTTTGTGTNPEARRVEIMKQ
jgi:flagellar motor protein MotB